MSANPGTALDRPDPVPELADVTPHHGKPVPIGAIPATPEHRLVDAHHLDRHRPFVRVHPDHDPRLVLTH
jgi:hypothetical protein